jgi:D-alanyl-D-alanine carboxypeptidase (penicillin-binding protein 5/6)
MWRGPTWRTGVFGAVAVALSGVLFATWAPGAALRSPVRDTAVAAVRSLSASGTAAADPPAGARLTVADTLTVPGTAALPWPHVGQAVLAVDGAGIVGSSGPTGRRVPIASVAKVMTAYVALTDHPLAPGEPGPGLTVSAADAAAYAGQVAGRQSVVKLAAGERLTERQALQALLIASADNVAQILARWDAGSTRAFVAKMNRTAAALGMTSTRYTDPSGLDAGTVSTALDQLALARRALDVPELAAIAGQSRAVIPVAGTIRNYNTLLGTDGITGLKTGSTTPAGGCLVFTARQQVDGRPVTVLGVVLGQPGTRATILPKVLAVSHRLVLAVRKTLTTTTVVRAGRPVATRPGPGGRPVVLTTASDVTAVSWPGATYRLSLDRTADGTGARLVVQDAGSSSTVATVPLVAAH